MNECEATTSPSELAVAVPADLLPLPVLVLDHYGHQTRRVLRTLPVIIGRTDRSEIILTDPWVSHEHCTLLQQDGLLVVRDMGSKNGVFLHGVRVLEAEVHSGDCLTVGRTEITVRYRDGDPVTAPTRQSAPRRGAVSPRVTRRHPAHGRTAILKACLVPPTTC